MEKNIKTMCNIPDKTLEILQRDIAEIKIALLGNKYNPTGGLLCRTNQIEEELNNLKRKYEKTLAYAAGAAAGVSIIITLVAYILDKFV